ncbi:extracellular solute-binding protein [Paenibacillus yanchengensis]|uniref:Extracellular solute-binding protein n=1 Tax=Paenibacillus yanchengensis TaxID=2035833 RepID=A0ABW4YQX2_9BACL
MKISIQHVRVILFVTLLLVVAACSKQTDGQLVKELPAKTNKQEEVIVEEASPSSFSEPEGELTWFGLMPDSQFEERFGQVLREQFPKLKINYLSETNGLSIEQVLASGTEVDMFFATAGGLHTAFAPSNLSMDMTALIEKHQVPIDAIEPAYLEQVTIEEKIHMLPVSESKFVMYYNKDLFDRFGVNYPRDGMTWDETLQLAKQLTRNEGGKQYIGLWMSPKHYMRVAQNSASFVDPVTNKATVNNEQWKFVFDQIFYNFSRDPGMQERARQSWLGHGDFNKDFVIAMYVYSSGWMNTHESSLAMNWDIASVPVFPEHPDLNTQPYANYVGITATSKQKDTAMQIVKYIVSEPYQTLMSKRGMITPLLTQSVRDAAFADYPFADKNIQALYFGKPAAGRVMTQFDEIVIEDALANDVIMEIVKGQMDVNTALRRAEETANKLIQEQLSQQ